jgi:hypothetical protein
MGNSVLQSTIFEPQRVEGCISTAKFSWFVEVSLGGEMGLIKLHACSLGGSDGCTQNGVAQSCSNFYSRVAVTKQNMCGYH